MGTKIVLDVPDGVSEQTVKKAREAVLLTCWEAGELSASRVAEELGLSAHEFLDLLAAKGLPVVRDFDEDALDGAKRKLTASDQP